MRLVEDLAGVAERHAGQRPDRPDGRLDLGVGRRHDLRAVAARRRRAPAPR